MERAELEKLVKIRQQLISKFKRLRDYKQNKNAIMREIDHARVLNETINSLDDVLKEHVKFDDK